MCGADERRSDMIESEHGPELVNLSEGSRVSPEPWPADLPPWPALEWVPRGDGHGDDCESEFISGPNCASPCRCASRSRANRWDKALSVATQEDPNPADVYSAMVVLAGAVQILRVAHGRVRDLCNNPDNWQDATGVRMVEVEDVLHLLDGERKGR